jgi:hypothetical protein
MVKVIVLGGVGLGLGLGLGGLGEGEGLNGKFICIVSTHECKLQSLILLM